jgi:hypothetical protein
MFTTHQDWRASYVPPETLAFTPMFIGISPTVSKLNLCTDRELIRAS